MEFREALETIRSEQATSERLFSGGGRKTRLSQDPSYVSKLTEVARFVADVYEGRRNIGQLQEAMTTSDFPQLFGDILDRQLYGAYMEAPYSWNQIAKRRVVSDFRSVKSFLVNGAEGLLTTVPENTGYAYRAVSDSEVSYNVAKYGAKAYFSWESMVNDDLDALKDMPKRFAKAARRTEENFVTALYADSNGPHASMFTVGNANIINTTNGALVTNPPLSIAGIQDGFTVLGNQLDSDSQPIMIESAILVVPPALEMTAYNIVNATQLELTGSRSGGTPDATATGGQRLITANWLRNRLKVVVNAYLPRISTTNGNTSWYMFADPNAARPALEVGFLRGHESPELFMKAPNSMRVGGGMSDPMSGSFENDTIEYKVRHVLGGTRVDAKFAVASNGTSA